MRLLDTQSHELCEFGDGDVPFYAILSHRWDAVEVSLQDLRGGGPEPDGGVQQDPQ